MFVLPVRTPVKRALFLSPDGTRFAFATPPVRFWSDQAVAATLATKLLSASRLTANRVRALPEGRFCAGTIVPDPSAAASTPASAAAPGLTVKALLVTACAPALLAAVSVNDPVFAKVTLFEARTPLTNAALVPPPAERRPVEVRLTVPVNPVTELLTRSCAGILMNNGTPAVAPGMGPPACASTAKLVRGPG